jgi:hypothetical protein
VARALARWLVDLTVAVVVLAIGTNFGVPGEDGRVVVVAVTVVDTVPVGVAIAVSVAIDVLADLGRLDASIDGAGSFVAARGGLTAAASELGIADFETVAEEAVLTARIVRYVLTTAERAGARVEGARDGVVALPVIDAGTAERDAPIVDGIVGAKVADGVAWPPIDHKGAIRGGVRTSQRETYDDPDFATPHGPWSVTQVPQKAPLART